jgi:hypothetical protein
MHHSPQTAAPVLARVADAASAVRRDRGLEITFANHQGPDVDVQAWRNLGVDRLIVAPWTRSDDAIAGMRAFARAHLRR